MNTIQFVLDDNEVRTRKRWLAFFLAQNIIGFLFLVIPLAFTLIVEPSGKMMWMLSTLTVALFLFAYLLYHCAYKKHGTAYLKFTLFTSIYPMYKGVMETISDVQTKAPGWEFSLVCEIVALPLFICFFIFGMKLIEVNKKIQWQMASKQEGFSTLISEMQNASSLDDLGAKFRYGIEKFGKGPRTFIKEEFRKKKKELKKLSSS